MISGTPELEGQFLADREKHGSMYFYHGSVYAVRVGG